METLSAVLSSFKDNNPAWTKTETFVIDKDCVEWAILEELFQKPRYFCASFMRSSTLYMLNMGKLRVGVEEQYAVEGHFRALMYAPHEPEFESAREEFVQNSREQAPDIIVYFQNNWLSCREMWANSPRGKHFTAGNTTTNRI
uniref:AlNc14C45G3694 protein n=1 Tax=Albugo laibachii Nc14 TaxID=890382 RepID=F0WAG8_9STRA|nr:AlNc14C45G3694 [Albugo laibachii Nc14]|eukprot:CCA18139.1 AlNc14C45G3694 [Albugo laibachii Nc14]